MADKFSLLEYIIEYRLDIGLSEFPVQLKDKSLYAVFT